MARQWLTLKSELALVLAQFLGPPAVEHLPELGDQMLKPAIVLGQGRDVGLERQPPRALGFEGGADRRRQDGEVDLGGRGHR
jgi:hypothetical protein